MAIGLILYTRARRKLPQSIHHVPNPLPRSEYGKWITIALAAVAIIAVAALLGVLNAANLATSSPCRDFGGHRHLHYVAARQGPQLG
ncbi:hypothetical protein ACFOLD_16910 [Kocuria carniphila]|uniref:hypothetical protein n=1 Tax=Kocuria carniphila TaxID=262208 RepID=UPI00360C7187